MSLNWFSYYAQYDGYGRYSSRLVQALQRAGVETRALAHEVLEMPAWMLEQQEIDWDRLNISCLPPFALERVPGRHWLISMTEGSRIPPYWVECIHKTGVERVIVPCEHNRIAFERSGVDVPIHVVPGGTDPVEFPLLTASAAAASTAMLPVAAPATMGWTVTKEREAGKPYTFLTIADRNQRKGWMEVYDAFYIAFGGKTTGAMDVRLIVKCRPDPDNVTTVLRDVEEPDTRILYQETEVADMAAVYAQADCVALPSRSEGWGMPHREAAMMGLPVIVQRYSGLDDGHTDQWAMVVERGKFRPVPKLDNPVALGEWRVVDVYELAAMMRTCYENSGVAAHFGAMAAEWLRTNQTWDHAASALAALIRQQTTSNELVLATA